MKTQPIILDGPTIRSILDGSTKQVQIPVKWPMESSPDGNHIIAKINEAPGFWVGIPMDCVGDMSGMIPVREMPCPYSVEDRLWVRETFWIEHDSDIYMDRIMDCGIDLKEDTWATVWYCATDADPGDYESDPDPHLFYSKHPSVHMPRWASRLTLEITAVSVEWSEEKDEWVWVIGVEKVNKSED